MPADSDLEGFVGQTKKQLIAFSDSHFHLVFSENFFNKAMTFIFKKQGDSQFLALKGVYLYRKTISDEHFDKKRAA